MDVAIIDVPWNGFSQAVQIGRMAEAYEINIAPHNYYSHLADLHSLHLCAVLPNVRIMEIDIDDVPWKGDAGDEAAGDQGRPHLPARCARLGRRHQRGGAARAPLAGPGERARSFLRHGSHADDGASVTIVAKPLTPEEFAPYGDVLAPPADLGRIYYDQGLGNLRPTARPSLSVSHAKFLPDPAPGGHGDGAARVLLAELRAPRRFALARDRRTARR